MQPYSFFVGIDVSKETLDYCLLTTSERPTLQLCRKNTPEAIEATLSELAAQVPGFQFGACLFCLEATGVYQHHLLAHLLSLGASVWVESARQIQYSLGRQRGKSDTLDAHRIACYALDKQTKARLWQPQRPLLDRLLTLVRTRQRLVETRAQLRVPLSEWQRCVGALEKEAACSKTLQGLQEDIDTLDEAIANLLKDDSTLNRLHQRMTSIPGIGSVVACEVILATNEFTRFPNPRKLACFAGVAPFGKGSGQHKSRPRVCHQADKRLKRLLHLAALGAVRWDQSLKAYYDRKVAEGKAKMLVLNNVRNKLIHRLWACVEDDRDYQKNYPQLLT
ncbi:MAG: IS110 family transposase [Sphingobacteriaceae bacterium]|nr:IS110 family transposase [Cytophagaceae bacterium]